MSDVYNNLNSTYVSGVVQKSTWLVAIVNFILNQKMINDLQNDNEKRVCTDLRTFTIEFFLQRFGNPGAGQQLLRDFIVTLKVKISF